MKKKILFVILISVLFGFKYLEKSNLSFVVGLHQESNSKYKFNTNYEEYRLCTNDRNPDSLKKIVKDYIGIPKNDSISYYSQLNDFVTPYQLFKSGLILKNDYIKIIQNSNIDTLNFSKIRFRQGLIFAVGFYKNKQFIISDSNHNKDFSDDIKYEFDINFRNNPFKNNNVLNELPITNYNYQKCYNGKIFDMNRKFILYPDKYNGYSRNFGKKEMEYFSLLKFKDIWKGEEEVNGKKIEFYFQGLNNDNGVVYIKPKEIKFSSTDFTYNNQFMYNLIDTIPIAGNLYKIDSISYNISKIYFRKISGIQNKYGNKVGDYVKNFNLKDLNNKDFEIQNIIKKKKYTLIEFWGTWCAPCIKMTPKIKKIEQEKREILSVISIAVDENSTKPQKYILKNKMNWINSFIQKNTSQKNWIIKQLNIQFYPTFILIDNKGKILLRGSEESYNQMLKFIK